MLKKLIILTISIVILLILGMTIYKTTSPNNSDNNNTSKDQENITTENAKSLVLYFSISGNTQIVANIIQEEVEGDIIRLETEQTYPNDYNELLDIAQEEQRQNARPKLSTTIDNIDQYDTIYLGYPNWWGDMPMAIYTFLDTYDLSGKTIAPFMTHGGSGLSGTVEKIQTEEKNATVTEGLSIYGDNANNSKEEVITWLNTIK